jgi:uncharacterized membrane protein
MATRLRKPRKALNWWIVSAFALPLVGLAFGLWSADTQRGTRLRVFATLAYVLVLVGILCFRRGVTRK